MDENTKKHIQSKLALLPRKPGCYLMKDNTGKVIYVGKAKILKNRVSSYFRGEKTGKTKALVSNISTFEYIVTESEKEAFLLEINLIKKYDPKYNIIFRDDKSYPYIALTTIPYPKLDIVRPRHKRVKKDVKLFGPYPSSYAARSIVNMLNRIYPLRKCKTFPDKPCLYYHIGECLGYCTKNVAKEKCEEMVKEITSFLNGNYNDIVIKLKKDMYDASEKLNFEKAGEIKELLDYIDKVLEKQKIDLTDNVNRDIFNAYEYKGYISMQVFHSRSGQLVERNSYIYEQNEIEFLPVPVSQAADQLMIAKWVIRNLGYKHGYNVTFAPKITAGKAGSGLHIHMRIMKDGKNQMLADGVLSETARKAIAGMMKLATSITAFGNTNPTSYFRLVPHQEAPTNICWGDRNRSVLVRVPLGWAAKKDMCSLANPLEADSHYDTTQKQTVEMRSPDGSADLYQLLAGLAVACRYGFEIPDALDIAEKTYVNVNIHQEENKARLETLDQLPDSCAASAKRLQQQRGIFEQHNVFSPSMIDGIIKKLVSYNDTTLREDLKNDPEGMLELVNRYFHCG